MTMRHAGSTTALLLLLLSFMSACSSSGSKLESIASELTDAVNRCVVDVRDRRGSYEDSANCRSMGRIAQKYIDAGGFRDGAPCQADRIAESARAKAWMALAMSRTGNPNLSIW
jgi:hypothetical protein